MAYTLMRDTISKDTVEALEQLLEAARAGLIVGLAFGAMLKRKRYLVNCAGEACRDPTTARGMVCALDDELREMVHSRAESNTTL